MEATKFYIGNELFFCENEERFALILEEKLGVEAADCFREIIGKTGTETDSIYYRCGGECDKVYQVQENCDRALSDIRESLLEIDVPNMTKVEIKAAIYDVLKRLKQAEF